MNKRTVPVLPVLENTGNLSKTKIMEMLEKMLTIRFSEERIAQRVTEKKIFTPCHLYIGQEACAVGVCGALDDTDYVFSNHRSHGHFLAKGGDMKRFFAEVYCREDGCSGGRGGSMHLCQPEKGLLGSSSIVAGVLGIGIGPGFRSKILGEDRVSVIFHGDCVPEEGIWHESLNFSAIMKLPVIYICENNLYAASSALEDRRVMDNISDLAAAHGLQTQIVDGNDLFVVYNAMSAAVERARAGEGPQFIELRTYRWLGHVGPRDDIDVGLRDYDELMHWKARCPIKNLEEKLLAEGICTRQELQDLHNKVSASVEEAEAFAVNSRKPDPATVLAHVYSSGGTAE